MSRFPLGEPEGIIDERVKSIYAEIIAELGFGIGETLCRTIRWPSLA